MLRCPFTGCTQQLTGQAVACLAHWRHFSARQQGTVRMLRVQFNKGHLKAHEWQRLIQAIVTDVEEGIKQRDAWRANRQASNEP